MRTLAPLGHTSRALFDELIETEKLRCWFCPGGYYEIYLRESGLEAARHEMRMLSAYGFHPELLRGAALREREPAITDHVVGGIFYPEAATIHPYQFVAEMAACAERHGAEFRSATPVAGFHILGGRAGGIELDNGEVVTADSVVLAAGSYSVPLLRQLGIHFPLQAAKSYHRDCESKPGAPHLTHACVLGERMVFCTPMDGFVRSRALWSYRE
jgi:glycine/D-amino acid oxidase-like deaminating enzyme